MKTPTTYRNVFILCTGRCGSMTFAKACSRFTNYSAGHETRCTRLGEDRLNFPAGHIEADNRLAWILGRLDAKFGNNAFYVHLKRNPEKVAESYDRRWEWSGSIVRAYNFGVLKLRSQEKGAARDMVDTINANIEYFLKDKTHKLSIDIDDALNQFEEFCRRIGAQGDMEGALAVLAEKSNLSKSEQGSGNCGRSEVDIVLDELRRTSERERASKERERAFKEREQALKRDLREAVCTQAAIEERTNALDRQVASLKLQIQTLEERPLHQVLLKRFLKSPILARGKRS